MELRWIKRTKTTEVNYRMKNERVKVLQYKVGLAGKVAWIDVPTVLEKDINKE